MSGSFGLSVQVISCLCLSSLLLLEWLALRTLMHETLLLRHLYEPTPAPEDALRSVRVRPFRAPLMDCSDVLTDADLLGRVTTLLFVRPDKLFAQSKEVFGPVLLSVWQKRKGRIYVVCSGLIGDCQLLRDKYQLGRMHNSAIDVVLDEDGEIRKRLSVTPVLAAVVVDANRKILKVGGLHSDEFNEGP